ncbi:Uncharacterized protein Fot_24676 [Forsythia ovata]|uniref:Uncharacterized protein n=1 Tax=Forsythia ovata TaxID=205694 RepID=A0ABD1U6X6_9LAMI
MKGGSQRFPISMLIQAWHLNSSKGKHITASFDQNVGEAFDNQDNLSKIDDHTVTNVQSSSKNSKASGHVPEMLMKPPGKKTSYNKRQSEMLQSIIRPKKAITSGETDEPSFDLGIDSQANVPCIILDNGLVLTEEDIQKIDDTVASKLAESGSKTEVFEVEVQPLDEGCRKKQKISSRIKDCNEEPDKQTRSKTSLYLEDDDIIFSEEDLRHMDESTEKNYVQFQKVSSQVQFVFRKKIE